MAHANYTLAGKRVYVAGHRGMVGAALVRRLMREGCTILTTDRADVDLRNQTAVDTWFAANDVQAVFLAAAKVGGIHANATYRAEFIYDNIAISMNVVHSAHKYGVEKLMFLGSSCIYPRLAPQPINEGQLLQGPLELTNEPYAIAKIAGIKLAESFRRQYDVDYISVMPTNLYGPGDNYHPENSHVVAALIRRFHMAKESGASTVAVWGTGTPRREFLFVDDMADACIFLMQRYSEDDHINVGVGQDTTILELARIIAKTVGFEGDLIFDPSRPDGTPRKLLDVARLTDLGWTAKIGLSAGLAIAYNDFLDQHRRAH